MLTSKPSVREKKLKKTNYETIVVVDASLQKKKGGLYNTNHELLSEKQIAKRSRFHSNQYQYSQHPILWGALNISIHI